MTEKKHRVAFLFGAGADSYFGLPLGDSFKEKTMETKGFGKTAQGKALKSVFGGVSDYEGYKYTSDTLAGQNVKLKEKNSYKQGLLDRYFHTLINPKTYGNKQFSVIVNYYWCCYFTLVEAILTYLKSKNIIGHRLGSYFLKGSNILDYKKIVSDINSFTAYLYDYDAQLLNQGVDSYYKAIANAFAREDTFSCAGVITTNYYKFAEILSTNIAYPNGQLKFFEYPSLLEVRDFSTLSEDFDEKKHIFFPFIFGQSYVKPIVHHLQIEEFKKIDNILHTTDTLVIVGYNINEDDNHLNAYLHSFVKRGGNLVCVTKKSSSHKETFSQQLKLTQTESQKIQVLPFDYEKEPPSAMAEQLFSELGKRLGKR